MPGCRGGKTLWLALQSMAACDVRGSVKLCQVWVYILRVLGFGEMWGDGCAVEGVGQMLRGFIHPFGLQHLSLGLP